MSTKSTEILYHCYYCGYIDNQKPRECPKCGEYREEEVYEY